MSEHDSTQYAVAEDAPEIEGASDEAAPDADQPGLGDADEPTVAPDAVNEPDA